MFIVVVVSALAGAAFAGCASESYGKACASCSFDENGKIDQSCKDGYQSSGTTCMTTSYPIMSAKYAQGNCSQVDDCTAELKSCIAQYSSGNDKADCQEGSVSVCYASADACMSSAARQCGEIEKQCPGSSAGFILLFAGLGFVSRKQKQ
jgi:hypothetical protein